jgi:kumamolisin
MAEIPGGGPSFLVGAQQEARSTEARVEFEIWLRYPKGVNPIDLQDIDVKGEQFKADDTDVARVCDFVAQAGLEVVEVAPQRRLIRASGKTAVIEHAFNIVFGHHDHQGETVRSYAGCASLPKELDEVITEITGLEHAPLRRMGQFVPQSTKSEGPAYRWPTDVARTYEFPSTSSSIDGKGQTIGIIEFGGGFGQHELEKYFKFMNLRTHQSLPTPKPKVVLVGGAINQVSDLDNSGEVVLDVEIAAAVSPGAKLVIYFGKSLPDTISAAIHDKENQPGILSISWSSAESLMHKDSQYLRAVEKILTEAAAMKVTVCVASGDQGATDAQPSGSLEPCVGYPGSSPHALACGGTMSGADGEVVWNNGLDKQGILWASGGGYSRLFNAPSYQSNHDVKPPAGVSGGRGVPDVAGLADRYMTYQEAPNPKDASRPLTHWGTQNGTSAVAPLWAALVAQLNQVNGSPLGFINPLLYDQSSSPSLTDIATGNNVNPKSTDKKAWNATSGWDPCTGLGVPNGSRLSKLIKNR